MEKLKKLFESMDKVTSGISAFTLFLMMVWIFVDVMLRTFFHRPIQGTIELTGEYLMVLLVYLSLSYTHKQDGHVKVTFLEEKFSKRIKNITKCMTNLFAACLFSFISILNFQEGLEYIEQNIRSSGVLSYPLAPALFIISLGMMMITLRLLIECISIIFPNKVVSSNSLADSEKKITG